MSHHTQLRRKAVELCVGWLKTLVPEDGEADLITVDNYKQFLPDETHYYANGQLRCHSMTPRWIYKKLKKNPDMTLQELLSETT